MQQDLVWSSSNFSFEQFAEQIARKVDAREKQLRNARRQTFMAAFENKLQQTTKVIWNVV